jgi:hypothetical protein
MPRICFFHGITIAMFWDEGGHHVAHFHGEHAGQVASIALDGSLLAGSLRIGTSDWPNGLDMAPEPLYDAARKNPVKTTGARTP